MHQLCTGMACMTCHFVSNALQVQHESLHTGHLHGALKTGRDHIPAARVVACDGYKQQTAQPHAHCAAVADMQADSKLLAFDSTQKDKAGQQQGAINNKPVTEYMQSTADSSSQSAPDSRNQLVNAAKPATKAAHDNKEGVAGQPKQDERLAQASLHPQSSNAASLPKTVRLQESLRKANVALQHYDSAPAFMQATMTSGPESARRATSPSLLRNQHLPGVTLHQKTAFPANMTMKHDAGISSVTQGRHLRASAEAVVPKAATAAPGAAAISPAARPQSPTAMHNQQLQQLWQQHSTAAPGKSLGRQQSCSALQRTNSAAPKRSASRHMPEQRVKQAAMLRQISNIQTASLPKKPPTQVFIEPFYEGTSHPLGHSQTWASQWLAMGSPDDLTDTVQTHSLPAPLLPNTVSGQAVPVNTLTGVNPTVHEGDAKTPDASQAQAALVPQSSTLDTPADQAVADTLVERDGASVNAISVAGLDGNADGNIPAMLDSSAAIQASAAQTQLAKARPATALGGIDQVVTQQWQLDLRRLHSARPGSGGSPTARSASPCLALSCLSLHTSEPARV